MADRPVETIEEASNSEKISDLILTENPSGFAPSDLIECRKCGRKNPPDRTGCLYCGHDFENGLLNTTVARVSYKSPEPWEDGFSIVFAGDRKQEDLDLSVAADLLRLRAIRDIEDHEATVDVADVAAVGALRVNVGVVGAIAGV